MLTQCAKSLHFGIKLSWYADAECSQQYVLTMGRGAEAQNAQKQYERAIGVNKYSLSNALK
jgi:hypothetical protein